MAQRRQKLFFQSTCLLGLCTRGTLARQQPFPLLCRSLHVIDVTVGPEFGGDWTEQKLDALGQYLRAYTKVLSKTKFRRIYIDAFAGTGYREQKLSAEQHDEPVFAEAVEPLAGAEPQKFLDGSAKIALKVAPPFHHFIFIESDDKKAQELEKLKIEFPAHAGAIDVRFGDANTTIQERCARWDKREARGVLFLDPFGMQTDWKTIEAVAQTECIDTWILFPFAANRLMTRDPAAIPPRWRERLNALFGTSEWEQRFYRHKTLTTIFHGEQTVIEKNLTMPGLGAFYQERLGKAFPMVAPNPRVLCTTTNRPLFQLFFAAAHPGKGGEIALRIAQHILDNM